MITDFRNYTLDELRELAKGGNPSGVGILLDEPTVDFLLELANGGEPVDDDEVDELAESIEDEVLQTVGTLIVTGDGLADGRKRLLAVKSLGCPQSLCATVVFSTKAPAND